MKILKTSGNCLIIKNQILFFYNYILLFKYCMTVCACARECARVRKCARVSTSVRLRLRVSCILTISNAADEYQQKDSTPEIHALANGER